MSYTFPVFPTNTSPPTVIYPRIVANKKWQGNIPESYFLGQFPDIYIDFDEVVAWLKNEETGHNVYEDPKDSNWGTRVSMYWGHTAGSTSSPGYWCAAFIGWGFIHFFKNHWGVRCPIVNGSTSVLWYQFAAGEGFLKYYLEDIKAGRFQIRAGDCIVWAHDNPLAEVLDNDGRPTGPRKWNPEIASRMLRETRKARIWAEKPSNRGIHPRGACVGTRHISMMTGNRFTNEAMSSGDVHDPNGEFFEEIQGNTDEHGNSRDGGYVRLKRKSINRPDIMGWFRFHGRSNLCTTTNCIEQERQRREEPVGRNDHLLPFVEFTPALPVSAGNSIVFNLAVVDSSGIKEGILFWRKQGTTVWQQKNTYTTFRGKTIFTIRNNEINPSGGLYSGTIQYYFSFKDNSPNNNITIMPNINTPGVPGTYYTVAIVPESGP